MKTHHQEKCAHCKGTGFIGSGKPGFIDSGICPVCGGIGVAPSPHTEGWEKDFDEKFVVVCPDKGHIDYGKEVLNPKYPNEIIAFIRRLLHQTREEAEDKAYEAGFTAGRALGQTEGKEKTLAWVEKEVIGEDETCLAKDNWRAEYRNELRREQRQRLKGGRK